MAVRPGDVVRADEPLATILASNATGIDVGRRVLQRAITINHEADYPLPLISHRVTAEGVVPYAATDKAEEYASQM
jgi:pyrimidine-nucleoside phosphorylase